MQATSTIAPSANRHPSAWRLGALAVGYLVMLAGAFSIFRVPIKYTTLMFLIGGTIAVLAMAGASYSKSRPAWWVMLVWLAGSILIIFVSSQITVDVRNLTPHPASYQSAWLICFWAFVHFRQVYRGSRPA